jgi:O-antigen ligase
MTMSGDAVPRIVGAIGAVIALVTVFALLSRLRPEWFPVDTTLADLPDAGARLKYPLQSWNGLASLITMGIPPLLAAATIASRRWLRIAGAVAVPLCVLAIHYTISRAGIVTALLGVAVFLLLHPRPLATLPTLAVVGAGSALLVGQGLRLSELADLAPGFESQQGEMALTILAVGIAVAVGMLGVFNLERRWSAPGIAVNAQNGKRLLAGGAAVALLLAVVLLATGTLQSAWEGFTEEDTARTTSDRVTDISGNLRYQQWQAAVNAAGDSPLVGIGPNTYEYYWLREGTAGGFSRYAHSLYFQSLAETGIIGFLLITGFVLLVVVVAIRRALAAVSDRARCWLAAAAGLTAAFAVAMATDWGWYLPAIVVPFLIVAAAILQTPRRPGEPEASEEPEGPGHRTALRIATAAFALALGAVAVTSWIYADRITASDDAIDRNDPDAALAAAESADGVVPKSGSAQLNRAIVLEGRESFDDALAAATQATESDPNNWMTWFVLSRIEEQAGDVDGARADYERAEILNPRSPVFLNNDDQSALTPGTAEGE